MNPTFTVSIDTEKRKASAAGLVAVGEKVDVVVTGLDATQIPEWEQDNDEGFTGPSLRFRIVAPDGKDLVRFPLAEGDAWTIGAEGELTAEVDFNTMPLRHWFHGYEIGAKAEVGMILDSVVDAMEYGRGTVKVLQWTASPAEDPTILPDWRKTLRDLNAAIVEIKDSVDLAEGYADDAEASAGVATEKAGVAVTAANNALSSKSAAEGFKSDAQTAASNAQGYKNDAQLAANTATTKAEEAAGSAGEAAQILEDIEAAIAGKAEQSDFEAEVTRATQKEEELENGLTEANDAISDNADAIDQLEESKADKTALDTLSDAIDSEAETREEKDAAICAKLNKEIADRQDADNLKADKATTYTKTEVDAKIAGVQTFQKYLVQTLPDPDEADMKGLYLVPTGETSEEGDLCEEWTVV
ncbi:MAG: hypothetical protein IIY62_00180, partial [Kiritimatiellae bacterium]|nr:hypothetical protein [Kiritimatiellia bacterium]